MEEHLVAGAVSPRKASSDRWRRDRVFYVAAALVIFAIVFYGFGRTFFFAPFGPVRPIRTMLKVHASVFTAWVLLFIAQSVLISARRLALHRRLGIFGGFVAAAIVIVGGVTVVDAVRLQNLRAGAVNLFGSSTQLLVFAVMVAAALWKRRQPELHKRLMLVGTLALAQAALGRIVPGFRLGPNADLLANALFMFSWVAYDLATRRRPPLGPLLGAATVVAIGPVGIPLVARSSWWLALTAWVQG